MKKLMILASFFSLLMVGCDKDDSDNITASQVSATLNSGSWRISYFWDTDHDETSNFSGYVFNFGNGNVVTAVKAASTVTGAWTTGTDNSNVKLTLLFNNPADFIDLSEDWHVIERSDTRVRMQHVSGGNGGTDFLTFERL